MNEELKEKYLDTKEDEPRRKIELLFGKLEQYEDEIGKDLSCFNVVDISNMYTSLQTTFDILSNHHSRLSAYTDWVIKEVKKYKLDIPVKRNNYALIHTDELHEFAGTKDADGIITREELLKMIKKLPNVSDQFIVLCLFEGIRGVDYSEIREITMDSFKGNTLHIKTGSLHYDHDARGNIESSSRRFKRPTERDIQVSDELIELARKASHETEYIPLVGEDYKPINLVDEPYIIKRTQIARNKGTQPKLTRRIVKIFDYLGGDLNANKVRNSGKVHYILEKAKELNKSTKEIVFGEEYNEMSYIFDDKIQRMTFWNKFESKLSEQS